ncbi:MAG: hypothetical protein HY271_14765 [Deltaproteobacteria bacterium]|nr:hypothetical protein [Deltaproteobacteria bacterium]
MCRSQKLLAGAAALIALAVAMRAEATSDPTALCQKTIVQQLFKYEKTHLKSHIKCLDGENKGVFAGPCPDAAAAAKIALTDSKVRARIALKCTLPEITTLGYRADCAYEAATAGREGQCAALPVTTPDEFAACLTCWKGAEASELIALLYASHASEVCGGSLDEGSPVCSDLDCTTPLPEQHDLGDTAENDCQRAISKAGVLYTLKRQKPLEKCLLIGGTKASCLADPVLQLKLAKAETQKQTVIKNKCGNRAPSATTTFCCKCGTGNQCMVIADRATCAGTAGCTVQEGKSCDGGTLKCVPGPHTITWWDNCPENDTCPGTTLTTLDDLIACVDTSADAIVDELLALQFPTSYPAATASPDATPTVTPTPP